MNNVTSSPEALQAFQKMYLSELDARVQRSEVVGAITSAKGSAAVFFDSATGKFTLVEKGKDSEEAAIYECVPREQWGRNVMLFGHTTQSGGYIASGHATLDDNLLKVKLASGAFYRIEVDPNAAHLQPFVFTAPAPSTPKRSIAKRSPFGIKGGNDWRDIAKPRPVAVKNPKISSTATDQDKGEGEDFTEEDLMRLRGEISLTSKPKKQARPKTH